MKPAHWLDRESIFPRRRLSIRDAPPHARDLHCAIHACSLPTAHARQLTAKMSRHFSTSAGSVAMRFERKGNILPETERQAAQERRNVGLDSPQAEAFKPSRDINQQKHDHCIEHHLSSKLHIKAPQKRECCSTPSAVVSHANLAHSAPNWSDRAHWTYCLARLPVMVLGCVARARGQQTLDKLWVASALPGVTISPIASELHYRYESDFSELLVTTTTRRKRRSQVQIRHEINLIG